METAVLVYSLSGNTRRVAEEVAQRLGARVTILQAPKVRPSPWAVLKLGFATLFGGGTPVTLQGPDPLQADLLILAAPVWAGRLSVPMRSWLAARPALPARIALVMTGDSPVANPTALPDFAARVGVVPEATLYISAASVKDGRFAPDCAAFCRGL